MPDTADFLREEYTIETPENVAFGYEVAGIGSRFIAALLDTLLLGVLLVLVNVLLVVALNLTGDSLAVLLGLDEDTSWLGGLVLALYALLTFGLIWGYYILFELLWNGQTPGKRAVGIRVIRTDGNPAGLLEIAIRNLVRVIDFLPFGYGVGLIVMFLNRQDRRLGDFAAGTLVVQARHGITLASLAPASRVPVDKYVLPTDMAPSLYPGWRSLSAADYDLIQAALYRTDQQRLDAALLSRLAVAIAAKLGSPPPADARRFLVEVASAYEQRLAR